MREAPNPNATCMEEVPSVGDVVLARREPDLEPERACVRSTQRDASGCATCAVRFEDGFMLKGVPVAALTKLPDYCKA